MTQHAADELQRLLAEEPFVRGLARQLVAGEADEVVQQTWLRAVQQGGGGVERPRSWLARIVRNVAFNLRRDDRRRRDRQRAVAAEELVPSSAELMEREERRRALVAAVDGLPSSLRTVVLLRWFEGLPPRRIAARLGVEAATVSTQLNRALELLRQRLDRAHGGDRRTWLLPLLDFAAGPRALPALPVAPLLTGAIAMTTQSKIVTAAAVLLAAMFAWILWPGEHAPATVPAGKAGEEAALQVQAQVPQGAKVENVAPAAAERRVVEPAEAQPALTGKLVVHVRYGDDHAPAPDRPLVACRPGSETRIEGRRARSDEQGTATFQGLPTGRIYVLSQGSMSKAVDLKAGETAEIQFDLLVGLTLQGIVVDAAGQPVADALVEVTEMARSDTYPDVIARTGADGRFRSRSAPGVCMVGARAPGHTASPLKFLLGKEGNTGEVKLVLGVDGGSVEGLVVDAGGRPVAEATVIIGRGELSGIGGRDDAPPFPALVRSDADGRFLAVGIPKGEQPVQARAPHLAPWTGTCDVAARTTVPLRIALAAGATVRGIVLDAEGKAVRGAVVRVGDWQDLSLFRTASRADGAFELRGLPAGDAEVRGSHDASGKGAVKVHAEAGSVITCELRLSRGLELKGQVVDPDGQPVAKLALQVGSQRTPGWFASTQTDVQGRFTAANCPENDTVNVTVRGSGFQELQRKGIDPKAGDVLLQLQREQARTVRIVGMVVGPDGKPVANAHVSAYGKDKRGSGDFQPTSDAGRFELGPMAPGTWRVTIGSTGHPEFRSEARDLAADATWDLGTVTLQLGGTVLVQKTGVPVEAWQLSVVDAALNRTSVVSQVGGGYRSGALVPGDYRLLASGKGIALQAVPFTILAGQETVLPVEIRSGTAQSFEFVLPRSARAEYVQGRLLQGSDFVGWVPASVREGEAKTQVWLAPDTYVVTAVAGELSGRAEFTVGAEAGPPLRVELR